MIHSMGSHSGYHPLLDTLRLYAGWLLACLTVVFAFGSYQELRALPVSNPLLAEWVESPLIRNVTALCFLFLLLSSVHRRLRGGLWTGVVLTCIGFAALAFIMAYG